MLHLNNAQHDIHVLLHSWGYCIVLIINRISSQKKLLHITSRLHSQILVEWSGPAFWSCPLCFVKPPNTCRDKHSLELLAKVIKEKLDGISALWALESALVSTRCSAVLWFVLDWDPPLWTQPLQFINIPCFWFGMLCDIFTLKWQCEVSVSHHLSSSYASHLSLLLILSYDLLKKCLLKKRCKCEQLPFNSSQFLY